MRIVWTWVALATAAYVCLVIQGNTVKQGGPPTHRRGRPHTHPDGSCQDCPLGGSGNKAVIDNCQPNPCKSGAKCHNAVNTFTCICPPGKKGKLCEDDESPGYDCTENKNPCTEENRMKRIFYFPHTNPHKFVQCDNFGRCFVMPCPAGLVWHKRFRTCVRPGTE